MRKFIAVIGIFLIFLYTSAVNAAFEKIEQVPIRVKVFVLNAIDTVQFLVHSFVSEFFRCMPEQRGSFEITQAFVQGYKNNIHMLAQQMTPRVFNRSRQEQQASKTDFHERIGLTDANDVTERHGDTPINNAPHSRRAVTLKDSDWGDLIDRLDRVRLLINPDDAYVRIAVASLNRKKDDIFIAAAFGIARAGEDGEINVTLPDAQKVVSTNTAGTALAPLNVKTLRRAMRKFDEAEIEDEDIRYLVFNGAQKEALLGETEVTSADFNTVRALVQGEIDTFLGFKFIRSERLPVLAVAITVANFATGEVFGGGDTVPAGSDRLLAYTEMAMISATGLDLFVDVGPRRDKKMSTQVFVQQSVGAVRMEEERVLEILCQSV